ncbi:MAG: protein-L-isoaspartate O-methyltransferase [Arhodomonas sp.]|nr:protein-L-isoaspartate O-methyltransferase [Arhodomonas sp.]
MSEVNLERARFNMVEQQIRPWEALHERILDALEAPPREDFVPTGHRNLAYADLQLPLHHDEVMLEPRVEARMLQALDPQPGERALEVGRRQRLLRCLPGTARRRGAPASTSVRTSASWPRSTSPRRACKMCRLEVGDAAAGWDDGQRYDVIAVTGSLPELHEGFHRSLAIGGRLFLIVGTAPIMEALLITRMDEDQVRAAESLFDTSVRALRGARARVRFEL